MTARIGRHTACKPMLDGTEEHRRLKALHEQEARYTEFALREMPDAVALWYRYLTLYDKALRREHESPSTFDDHHRAWDSRLRLASTAAATSKLALDAALAGYYSQAFALLRHMLETWQQMVYVRINPAAAQQWYSPDGKRQPTEPLQSTIVNKLRKYGKQDRELGHNAAEIERQITYLHKGAHPSGLAAAQVETGKPGFLQLGANYDRRFLGHVMSKGIVAQALLVKELTASVPVMRLGLPSSGRLQMQSCVGTKPRLASSRSSGFPSPHCSARKG